MVKKYRICSEVAALSKITMTQQKVLLTESEPNKILVKGVQ